MFNTLTGLCETTTVVRLTKRRPWPPRFISEIDLDLQRIEEFVEADKKLHHPKGFNDFGLHGTQITQSLDLFILNL